jgi:hypothetical protein
MRHGHQAIKDCNFFLEHARDLQVIFIKEEEKNPICNTQAHAQTHMHTNSTLTHPYIFWNMSVTANDKKEAAQIAPCSQ